MTNINDEQNSENDSPQSLEAHKQHTCNCKYGSTNCSCNGRHRVEKSEEFQAQKKVSYKPDNGVQWTARKKLQVFLMASVNFVTFVAFSVLTPFFPNEVFS